MFELSNSDLLGAIVLEAYGSDGMSMRIYRTRKHGDAIALSNKHTNSCVPLEFSPLEWRSALGELRAQEAAKLTANERENLKKKKSKALRKAGLIRTLDESSEAKSKAMKKYFGAHVIGTLH